MVPPVFTWLQKTNFVIIAQSYIEQDVKGKILWVPLIVRVFYFNGSDTWVLRENLAEPQVYCQGSS